MNSKSIAFLRFNTLDSDSRLLKEIHSASKYTKNIKIFCLSSCGKTELKNINGAEFWLTTLTDRRLNGKLSKLLNMLKFNFLASLWLIHNRKWIDIVHFADLETAWLAFWIAKILQLKTVYDIYDYYADTRNFSSVLHKVIVFIETRIINNANQVIVCSDDRIKQISPATPKAISIIYNSPEWFEPENLPKTVNDNLINIVYVGGLIPYRMIDKVLEVVQADERLKLTIAGSGMLEKQVREFASECQRIIYLGEVPYSKVSELESKANIMLALYDPVIKNHKYASPNKFFDAFMLGKPLIMVKGSGMSSWVSSLHCGAVIETSSNSLQQGINKIIESKMFLSNDIQHRMQKVFKSKFSWKIMESRLIDIYRNI